MSKVWTLTMLAVSAGWAAAADPMPKDAPADITMTVTASATETTLPQGGQNAEPVTLTIIFKNVSGKEQKLDITRIERLFLSLKVTGPDGKAVPMTHKRTGPPGVEGRYETELKTLAAGDAWEVTKAVPGRWFKTVGNDTGYVFDRPGTYQIVVTYKGTHADKEAWHGTATSKTIELKVKEAGK